MFDLFYALVLMLAFCIAMGVAAFLGWLLIERDNAPFKHLSNQHKEDDL